jgi:hypothetical protein
LIRAIELEELPKEIPIANRSPVPLISSVILEYMEDKGCRKKSMEKERVEGKDKANLSSSQSSGGKKVFDLAALGKASICGWCLSIINVAVPGTNRFHAPPWSVLTTTASRHLYLAQSGRSL